jgi:prepilin-type N-terminal cleavage/methylation domain-containing protein
MTLRRGQTMLELIFAIAVIGVGLLAATTLVFYNLMLSDRDKTEITAVNLAREGLELAKNKRDSNWLAGAAFDAGMYSGTDYTGTWVWTGWPGTSAYVDFTANDFSDPRTKVMLSDAASAPDFMVNWNTFITGTTSTFSRLMTFNGICANGSVVGAGVSCAGLGSTKIGIRAIAEVRWTLKNAVKQISMTSDLYDWR